MKMSTPFPGRRRKMSEARHEKMEGPAEREREYREPPKRPTLKLKKRGK